MSRESICRHCHTPIYRHASGWTHGCGFVLCRLLWFSMAEPEGRMCPEVEPEEGRHD